MNLPSALASIATTLATDSGPAYPVPRTGLSFMNSDMSASSGSPGPRFWPLAPDPSVMPDEMEPGCTEVNRMPSFAYSDASAWVIDCTPPFDAAYAAMYGWAKSAEVELKFTTAASVPCVSAGIDSRITVNAPTRFTRSTCSNSATLVSCVCEDRRMPAAFTSTSSPPSHSTAAATPARTDSSSATLSTTVESLSALAPAFAVVSARPASLMSAATTRPPSASMRSTVAWPIPDPPPVTSARRFS